MFLLVAVAAVLVLSRMHTQTRCPVTGSVLTPRQHADPKLRIGGKTVCCKDCVRTYAKWLKAEGKKLA